MDENYFKHNNFDFTFKNYYFKDEGKARQHYEYAKKLTQTKKELN